MEESSRASGPASPAERQGSVGGPPPPPSPLSGCYLLIVVGEPHSPEHRDIILQRVAKGFLSWDISAAHVDLEKELQALTGQAPEGEEARNGERLIQYATENLVTEVLIHPQVNTLLQCVRNLLSSFTRHRHLVHAGYTFAGTGSWCLQDGTFSLADFIDAFQETEVQRVLRAYENCVTVDIHCSPEGDWTTERLSKESFSRLCKVRVNPDDCLTAGSTPIANFINYLSPFLRPASIEQLLEPSDVVGNIRFSHPTLYVFPGGQGDAALFGINGFNMLVDGGFARKACFWDFARHLDRLDAVLITRLNNGNVNGISAVLRRKKQGHVYPQIGHFFCNVQERRHCASPDGDKDRDPLLINLADEGHDMVLNLRQLQLRPHVCYREGSQVEPVNLYHKVGHGKLDMYIISPARDSREVKEFLTKWNSNDPKLFSIGKKDSKEFHFPLQNLISICALLVWQPANPNDTITRILFPGSTPQHKIFEGLEKLRHLEFLKFPVCSARSLSPSASTVGISSRASSKQRTAPAVIDKLLPGEGMKMSRPTSEVNKHASKAATIPVAGSTPEAKPVKASTPVSSAPAPPITKASQAKPKADKTLKSELTKQKTDTTKTIESERASAKTEKTTKVSVEGTKSKIEHRSKVETKTTTKSRTDSKPPRSTERKIQKAGSTEKKTDMKSSPTTPKKSVEAKVNGVAPKSETSKTARTSSKTRPSPSATPAKSTKEANNRKVVESKYHVSRVSTARASASRTTKKDTTEAPAKTERKPISRRPKTGSPTKAPTSSRPPGSPAKSSSAKSTPTPSVKSEKDGVIRKTKAETERLTTDSSAVSTPSTVDPETALLKSRGIESEEKSTTLMNGDLTKEEKTVVQEIEDAIAAEEAKEVEQEEEVEEQVREVTESIEITVETTEAKEEDVTVEEEITKEEEEEGEEEEDIKAEVIETVQSSTAQEETEREAEEEEDEGVVQEKESEVIEDEVQQDKQILEKEEVEATEEEQTEDMEDMEEDEAPIDIRESLQAELELEAKREVAEDQEAEEEEEEEYLVIEKEEVEQAEESMQEQESLESHIPEDAGVREVETEDEGELQKHLRDEADSEKLKRTQEEVKVNGFRHETEEQVHEEEIVKELDVKIATLNDDAEAKKVDIGKVIEKQLEISVQQKETLKEETPPSDETDKEKQETISQKQEEPTPAEVSKPEGIPLEAKEQIQEEVQEIISSAKEIVSKTKLESEKKSEEEEPVQVKDQSKDESAEEKKETEEVSSTSPEEKLDVSSEKNKEVTEDTRDTDQKFEEQDEAVEVKETGSKEILDQKYPAEESQPDEKFSTTVESAATTAPTLPEDERIPLDEIKEIVEEKYVKEETKEKEKPEEVAPRFEQPTTLPQVVIPAGIGLFDQHPHHPIIHRDIVKTPDEVADLPVHEEVDPGTYDSEEYPREIPKQKPEVEDIKSPEYDIKGELQLKYEEAAKPSQEEKETKETDKPTSQPIAPSQPDQKVITEKLDQEAAVQETATQGDQPEAVEKIETALESQNIAEIADTVKVEQELHLKDQVKKEEALKPEEDSKDSLPQMQTEIQVTDEAETTDILKDAQKPQEISVLPSVESKEKDTKKDELKTERKTEAVETPQSEISDIESKDKDTEKGIFKEEKKETEIIGVKDITSQFISQERMLASGDTEELPQGSVDIQSSLQTLEDEQQEDEKLLEEKKSDSTVTAIKDQPEIEDRISSDVSMTALDKDTSKLVEKEVSDTDVKLTKAITSDIVIDAKDAKPEDTKISEVGKPSEVTKEPGILGDSSALSATYLEIIEKLQKDVPEGDVTTKAQIVSKDQESADASDKDTQIQEIIKSADVEIDHEKVVEEKQVVKEEEITIKDREKLEEFEEKQVGETSQVDTSVPKSEIADEKTKATAISESLREVIDLQDQQEISETHVALDVQDDIKIAGDTDGILKESTIPSLLEEAKSLTKETMKIKETSEKQASELVNEEKELKDNAEVGEHTQLEFKEVTEAISTATKVSEEEIVEKAIRETDLEDLTDGKKDDLLEKEIQLHEVVDEKDDKHKESLKDEMHLSRDEEDKSPEHLAEQITSASTVTDKDIHSIVLGDSLEYKVQEIPSDITESLKIVKDDDLQSDQKEILESADKKSEAQKVPIEKEEKAVLEDEKSSLEDKVKEPKVVDEISSTADIQEITKPHESTLTDDQEDHLKTKQKESSTHEEVHISKVSEEPLSLTEKELKEEVKQTKLPLESDEAHDQIDIDSIKEITKPKSISQTLTSGDFKTDDLDFKKVEESISKDSTSAKEQIISDIDKSVTEVEITQKQTETDISKTAIPESDLIVESLKIEQNIIESTIDITDKKEKEMERETESLSGTEISEDKRMEKETESLSGTEISEDKKMEEVAQHKITEKVKSEQEESVKEAEVMEEETIMDASKQEETEKGKDITEIIEGKEDHKIHSSEEPAKKIFEEIDDVPVLRKDAQEVNVTECTQKTEEDISSVAGIQEQTIQALPKKEIKEREVSDVTDQKIIDDISESKAVEQKTDGDYIQSISIEPHSVPEETKEEEITTDIQETEGYKQEKDAIPDIKQTEVKTEVPVGKIEDTETKIGEASKTEDIPQTSVAYEVESKTEKSEQLEKPEKIDKTELKTEVSEIDKLDIKENEMNEQTLEQTSAATRKESLKTEEKIERDTVITEKDESTKEVHDTQAKPADTDTLAMNAMSSQDEQVISESKDSKQQLESQDTSKIEERERKSHDQIEDDAGDSELPPSPGDEYVDSGLEEEPVFTKLEAPEHPEYVTVTPDSTPASPKALPSFVKAREEVDISPQTDDVDSDTKIDRGKKDDVDDFSKKQSDQKDDTEIAEKSVETLQKVQQISEPSSDTGKHLPEEKITGISSKDEEFVSSITESESFPTKSESPPKSPHGVVFKEEASVVVDTSKPTSDEDEIKTTKVYDKTAIAEAKMLDDFPDVEETITYTTTILSKDIDESLSMGRKVEETVCATHEDSTTEISTSIVKSTVQADNLDSIKEVKNIKSDEKESVPKHTSAVETIVSSISDTKISEKAEIESSEKEIMKSTLEESSDIPSVIELKASTVESSQITSEIASSEIVSVKKSTVESTEQTTEEISNVTTITSESKELTEDSTLSTTVKKMLVTASSEDGGAETVLCATGTIKSIDTRQQEIKDTSLTGEESTVESETCPKLDKESTKSDEKVIESSTESVQVETQPDETTGKSPMKVEKPVHQTVTDVKHTNGHLHESDVDIQSTDEEEIVDGKRVIKTKKIKTTTTTKVVKKSVSESTDSEDDHKDSFTEETEIGEDGKIITRKITKTYRTIVKQEGDGDVTKSPSKSVEMKDYESSKLTSESTEKEGSVTFSELLAGSEPTLASTTSTTTTTIVTKVLTGTDGEEELVKSTTEKVVESDALKSTTITTDIQGDIEVTTFKEVSDPKISGTDVTDISKVAIEESTTKDAKDMSISSSEIQSSDSVQTTLTKDTVKTITKSDLVETTSSISHESHKVVTTSETPASKDTHDEDKEINIHDDSHTLGGISGPLAAIKKESTEMTRSTTPGSDVMSERDFDAGGPSTPHSDISSGQVSRAATNIWGSEGRPGSQHYDSDEEEEEGPVSPLSVTSQVAPSPPPPHFDFEMPEPQKSPEIGAKHSTVHSVAEEHTKQGSEIYKGPQQALTSSMTSSYYGSLPAEPPLSPQSFTMKPVDPMSASFIMQSDDPEHASLFSPKEYSTYAYGEYEESGSTRFEHFSSTSQVDPDVDFQQALFEHRAARGEDLTSASTSTTYHYESKSKDVHGSPEKIAVYEQATTAGVNGQKKEHSFKEFKEDYGNGNLAGAKQFEDLMNRNRQPGHESKLNGKSTDEYSDFSGPTSTESYSQEIFTTKKISTVEPGVLRNGADEKKTFSTSTVTSVTKTAGAESETKHTTQSFTGPSTAAQAFPEPPQGFGLPSVSKTETKKDPIEGWGKPLGLPAPAPPPTNNTNAQGEVMGMTNKGTPKKEKKVMQMKKSMMISENNKTTGGQIGKDKTKSPESPVKQKAGSNKVGIGNAKSSLAPIYVDLSYVPHHGNSYYTALDFFKKVRARYYVFSGTEPSREVYNALLEAKQTWEDKDLEVTIIPTYDTDTLGYWVAENEDALAKCKIDLSPSASRCTINLQDHETSCSAYRLEF